ncbi:hypothetical protein MRX96_031547 [Rhipicephalus microplus]
MLQDLPCRVTTYGAADPRSAANRRHGRQYRQEQFLKNNRRCLVSLISVYIPVTSSRGRELKASSEYTAAVNRLEQKITLVGAQNTKIINEETTILGSESADRATLIALKERLASSNEKLKKISEEMEEYISTEELASEYVVAADYEDQAVAILPCLQCRIEDINNLQKEPLTLESPQVPFMLPRTSAA